MVRLVSSIAVLVGLSACMPMQGGPVRGAETVIIQDGNVCHRGPHEIGRTVRLPGVAASTDRPRNPHEDDFLHCRNGGTEATGQFGTPRPRRP